jgi:hypothetical protein
LINPLSKYYLSINTGFPNEFDRARHRDGSFLMIHGDCLSIGCYAMADEQIGEIYSLARDALLDGQESFQIQAYISCNGARWNFCSGAEAKNQSKFLTTSLTSILNLRSPRRPALAQRPHSLSRCHHVLSLPWRA